MSGEKIHSCHITFYKFRKGVTIGTAVENIQDVYQDRASVFRTVEKWFAKFRHRDFHLIHVPRSDRASFINDDVVLNLLQNNQRIWTEEVAEKLNVDRSTRRKLYKTTEII
ncbi:Histone-lysine N-methyltransferase SETMAR [Anthophora retusa]